MIFYLTHNPTRLHGTQADAKAVNRNFEQIDIPTSKHELMEFIQKLYTEIDNALEMVGTPVGDNDLLDPVTEPVVAPGSDTLDAELLETQVSALGELGAEALDRFDGWSEITGISATFARGVALLNVIASDDHQLARVFLRDRLNKRKRFG